MWECVMCSWISLCPFRPLSKLRGIGAMFFIPVRCPRVLSVVRWGTHSMSAPIELSRLPLLLMSWPMPCLFYCLLRDILLLRMCRRLSDRAHFSPRFLCGSGSASFGLNLSADCWFLCCCWHRLACPGW